MTGTVFVTGGAGYVGSHCCKAFATAGWRVVVYDNLTRGWRDLVKWGPLIEGDINDEAALRAAFRTAKPDAVAHFAAFASVSESIEQPGAYYQNNVVGTLTLLEAMREAQIDKLIFSSSCASYGVHDALITEETPQRPINPYGASKMMAERIIRDFGAAHDIRSIILRYFNAAGCDAALETGERDDAEPRIIPAAIRGAMKGDGCLTINGDDFPTRDGTCVRDFVHVTDLADAHIRALSWLTQEKPSDAFNLGAGAGVSVKEIADIVENVTGKTIARKIGPRRLGDPPSLVANAAKAQRELGWRPQHSDMETIVRTALAWSEKDKVR